MHKNALTPIKSYSLAAGIICIGINGIAKKRNFALHHYNPPYGKRSDISRGNPRFLHPQ